MNRRPPPPRAKHCKDLSEVDIAVIRRLKDMEFKFKINGEEFTRHLTVKQIAEQMLLSSPYRTANGTPARVADSVDAILKV